MTQPPVRFTRLTTHSFQAWQEGDDRIFVIREIAAGWKTEGHPGFDGMLCGSRDELIAKIEGRDR